MNVATDPPTFHVIIAEPKFPGNVGAVARSMANFSIDRLILINPCDIDSDECRARAKHAQHILDNATVYDRFEDAIKDIDYLAATSSIDFKKDKKHLRNPMMIDDFSKNIYDVSGNIGLLFGREDYGLYNHEIAACDVMIKIPTNDEYPVLNLSHAVTCVLYSLHQQIQEPRERRIIDDNERDLLNLRFSALLDEINYTPHKKENTTIMLRRILGRALLSTWEYHTLMGVLSQIEFRLSEKKK